MINLMELGANVAEIKADAMATDVQAPPEPGTYRISLAPGEKVKFNDKHPKHPGEHAFLINPDGSLIHDEKGFLTYFYLKTDVAQKNPIMQLVLQPFITIDQPGGEPRKYTLDKLWASVMVLQGVKTSMVDTLLRSITGQAGVGMKDFEKIANLYQLVMAGQAIATATCDWEARHSDADIAPGEEYGDYPLASYNKKRLSTAVNFPKDANGKPIPVDIDPTDGSPCRTKLVVKGWLPAAIAR